MLKFFRFLFCTFNNNSYLCSDTTSNLIYIYHFPRGDAICEDGSLFLLSAFELRARYSSSNSHVEAFGTQFASMEIGN